MPGIAEVNEFPGEPAPDGVPVHGLVIAHDVLGGVFALNLATSPACGRPGEPGEVVYFAPDSMTWEPMEGGYGSWLAWALSGTLGRFYQDLRWPGWEDETAGLNPRQGITVYPFLWSKEARDNLAATTRRPAAMRELLGLHHEFHRQLATGPDPGFLGTIARPTEDPALRISARSPIRHTLRMRFMEPCATHRRPSYARRPTDAYSEAWT